MKRSTMLGVVAAFMFASHLAFGQTFPNRPIRMIVPFPPGGTIDIVSRLIVTYWVTNLNQQIVIDNRGGAGGTVGTELVARASADGYTILYGNSGPLSIGPNLYTKLGYDLFKDLAPVSLVGSSPFILFSATSLPVNSVSELITYAKARPGQLNYASSGVGSGIHLTTELFKNVAGIEIVHVPFKGLGQAVSDIAGGHIHVLANTYSGTVVHLKAGRLKALLSGGSRRIPQLPDVPTGIEAGLPGFHSTAWHAIVAPAGTPRPVILKLQQTLASTLASPELREQIIVRENVELVGSSPEELLKFLRSESTKWAKVIKESGAKVD